VKGTEVHVVVDSQSLPLSAEIGPENKHDSKRFIPLLKGIKVNHGIGRPKTRPGGGDWRPSIRLRRHKNIPQEERLKANIPVNRRNRLSLSLGDPTGSIRRPTSV